MSQARSKRSSSENITRDQPLSQVHETMRTLMKPVKNATDAKSYLTSKNWLLPEETISLKVLARTLFSGVIEHKLSTQAANTFTAVAFLITEQLEEGIAQNIGNALTKHLLDSLVPITAGIQTNIENHIRNITDNAKTYTEITEKLQSTQEKLEETAQRVTANTRSYSQVAAITPNSLSPSPPQFTPNASYSQIQIRNREEIKRRQVLIDFDRTEDMNLESMDETTLARKTNDALNTVWAATPEPKLPRPKLKTATLMRNGGLLLEFDSSEAAEWLKGDDVRESFLTNVGSGANIKNRTYQVIVQFVPIQFRPEDDQQLRDYENFNGLALNSVLKAEWIKPVKDRKRNQRVATMRVFHKDASSANKILSEGASVLGKRTVPKKPKKEPIRCLKCQNFGHERRDCRASNPSCARCAKAHETDSCDTERANHKCMNCLGPHPSFDRDCPKFEEKCRQTDSRCPKNNLAFYPTDDSWTWVTIDRDVRADPPAAASPSPPRPGRHNTLCQAQLTGANNTPLGPPPTRSQESQPQSSQ